MAGGPVHFLADGGECGALARAVDWAATPLGPPEGWPASLKTIAAVVLHSRHPMFLWWGPELVQLYNDAYVPSFGRGKHPAALGQRGRECWEEIWPIIGPQIEDVMLRGEASWHEDQLVPIARNGRIEEVYWTYGYSPVFDDEGRVGGVLVVCTETTGRVLSGRRLALVRSLAVELSAARSVAQVARIANAGLARAPHDAPFALFLSRDGAPEGVGIDAAAAEALSRELGDAHGRVTLAAPLALAPWPEPVTEVYVLPLAASLREKVAFGLSPRLPFDRAYESFLVQLVEPITGARARLRAESERRNLLVQAPVATAVLVGPEHLFELANPLCRQMVGGRELEGKTFAEAFPELRDTALPGILDGVYARGESLATSELCVPLQRPDGVLEDRYFKLNLEPMRDADGDVFGQMAVAVDITEMVTSRLALERTHAERAALLADAEAAARAKDEFLAMLGHELRNPLAPILTALELMKLQEGAPLARERELIARQAEHLVQLVDDLLDVSRVARGKIVLRRSRVALAVVVARAVELASPLFEQKAHSLVLDVPPQGLDVDADPLRLAQVLANLLTNAAKYTPRGGRVVVEAAREGAEVVLRVSDNGSGIAPGQLSRLFEAFFQGPRAFDRSEGGLGLGLALVKSLVGLHGGSVTAHSEGLDKGSTFELRLPLSSELAQTAVTRPPEGPAQSAPPMRVLLVDDNADMIELFQLYLERVGFVVGTALDGPSALEAAAGFAPEVAVLDLGLPGMDGYELAAQLRARLGPRAPRLIAMTGYGQADDREKTRRAGFEAHLVKPVEARALVAAITALRGP